MYECISKPLSESLLTPILLAILAGGPVLSKTTPQEASIPAGMVVDTVRCLQAPKQTYSLYLPRLYTRQRKWPIVFFYDPAARGKLPVNRYAGLAEEFQVILVGSNNSRNGPIPPSLEAVDAVTQDVLSRFTIDPERILISGFSGGSRLAMLVASQAPRYAGIIACGAGFFPNAELPLAAPIPYIELIGNRDPNFNEALEVELYLTENRYPHNLHYFEGGHEWPVIREYRQALFWQWLHFRKKDNSVFPYDRYVEAVMPTVKSLIDSADFYLAYLTAGQCLSELPPAQSSRMDSIRKILEANPQLRIQAEEFLKLKETELRFREEWSEQFARLTEMKSDTSFNILEFDRLISRIGKLEKSRSRQKIVLADRLSGVMTLRCYEQYNYQFKSGDYLHATLTARVLSRVENSSWSYFLLARAWAARGIKKQAFNALSKAIDQGLKQKKMIEEDPYLSKLQAEPRYKEVLRKLM